MCGHHSLHGIYTYPDDHRRAVTSDERRVAGDATHATRHTSLTMPCPHCQYPVQEEFVFCPRCGAEVLTACPACHRAVRADWTHCAFCGADLVTE
ncbi:MAG: zinc ribbon domain-containing protein [Chloroflexi bacterium]|nr:zinc ribbon domain-containing protein [Chloroflexota bacterium]